ncbi:DUF221-domain-containing protein [Gigaspora margarita]|uniref:DUF221-domain-containing protein n=1 Tax=Gigaspora margarita TaxID=4874 RepID=A0A8H4AP26_GIGMA|nr:DUF221-domain-containing protein [Gigaspora margarita]
MLVSDQLPSGINISEPPIHDNTGRTTLLTTQLIFAGAIGIPSFLLFCFLRKRWSTMFAPRSRLRLDGLAPKTLPDSFFGWIVTLFKMSEDDVLDVVGLDAAVLLSFFIMSYKLFAFCSFFGLVILSPIKLTSYMPSNHSKNPFDNPIGIPENGVPESLESYGTLLSYVIFTWVFSLATFYFAFENYRGFSRMRHRYYCKWKNVISARTVMVTVLPKHLQEDNSLAEFYKKLDLGFVENAVVYKNVRKLKHALEKRTYYLRELERACQEYLGNPCYYPDYDPNKALEEFKETGKIMVPNIPGERPKIRTGCLFLFGKKVDKIEYYTDLFKHYDDLVAQGRNKNVDYKPTSVGFVTFKNIISAQLAAQVLIYNEPFQCHTTMAPEPWDVYWRNLIIRQREMLVRTIIVNLLITLMVSSWGMATFRIASLLELSTLEKVFPWLANLAKKNKILKWFIQSTLPPIALTALNNILPPRLMTYLSSIQGFHTRSTIELSTFAKFFFFLILTPFEIPFAKALLEDVFKNPTDIANQLATTLPGSAPLFINLVVFQGVGLLPVRLVQMGEIAYALLMRIFFAKTPREYAEASAPPFLDYGQELPPVILIFVIVLIYSSITPIILPFGAIYFFLGYLTYKYLLLYVYFHPYETSGLVWPKIFNRIITGLYIYQLMMIGYLSLRNCIYMALSLTPLLVVTAIYYYYVNEAYARIAAFVPLNTLREDTADDSSSTPSTSRNKMNIRSDIEIYHADPELYTDYSQPPMTLYNGVLNTGMENLENYGAPALVGKLPWLWLPLKGDKAEINKPGFFRRLLGFNNKNDQPNDEERVPLLSESAESESVQHANLSGGLRSRNNVASGSGSNSV